MALGCDFSLHGCRFETRSQRTKVVLSINMHTVTDLYSDDKTPNTQTTNIKNIWPSNDLNHVAQNTQEV